MALPGAGYSSPPRIAIWPNSAFHPSLGSSGTCRARVASGSMNPDTAAAPMSATPIANRVRAAAVSVRAAAVSVRAAAASVSGGVAMNTATRGFGSSTGKKVPRHSRMPDAQGTVAEPRGRQEQDTAERGPATPPQPHREPVASCTTRGSRRVPPAATARPRRAATDARSARRSAAPPRRRRPPRPGSRGCARCLPRPGRTGPDSRAMLPMSTTYCRASTRNSRGTAPVAVSNGTMAWNSNSNR